MTLGTCDNPIHGILTLNGIIRNPHKLGPICVNYQLLPKENEMTKETEMKNSKYSLHKTDLVTPNGKPLFRIVAERDVRPGVNKGDEGGLVESEKNLSDQDSAWVFGEAQVFGNAWVFGKAQVFDDAQVYHSAVVSGSAVVFGDAQVFGKAQVYGDHRIVSGWAFATKHPDWNITEIQVGDYVTLVRDGVFEPVKEEPKCAGKIVEIDGKQYELREVTK